MKKEENKFGKDPLTGETFLKKRSNQVFANRENQIRYNNQKAYEKRKAKSLVDKILDKNRIILKIILGSDDEVVRSYDFLSGAGFNFGCSTHSVKIDRYKWICVYDYAYLPMDNETFKIIKLNQ